MSRQTSIDAYYKAVDSGLISKRRAQVLKIVAEHGPLTANEAWEILKANLGREFRYDSNTRARFTELRDQEVIRELGTRACSITKQTCILWEMSFRMPIAYVRGETSKEKIKRLEDKIQRLEREIDRLLALLGKPRQGELGL